MNPNKPKPPPLPPNQNTETPLPSGGGTWVSNVLAILVILALGSFIIWSVASTFFIVSAQRAVSETTVMCTDRMLAETDARSALRSQNESLRTENMRMRGRLDVLEGLLGLSKEAYAASKGIGGN